MTNLSPEVDPSVVIRAYIWAVLKANDPTVWDETKYDNLIPIVPLSEEPELSEFTGPHITYLPNWTPSNGARSFGQMTLVIADDNFRRLLKTLNTLRTALDRKDETARDINKFSSTVTPFIGLRFGTVKTDYAEGPTPGETEGSRDSALLAIEYEFYCDYDVTTSV